MLNTTPPLSQGNDEVTLQQETIFLILSTARWKLGQHFMPHRHCPIIYLTTEILVVAFFFIPNEAVWWILVLKLVVTCSLYLSIRPVDYWYFQFPLKTIYETHSSSTCVVLMIFFNRNRPDPLTESERFWVGPKEIDNFPLWPNFYSYLVKQLRITWTVIYNCRRQPYFFYRTLS